MFINIFISIIFYILILALIYKFKPSMMFDLDGNIKRFDINSSIITLDIIAPILALFCYYITLIIIN